MNDHISETREAAAGLQHPEGFIEDLRLVGREIDDAVGDDDIDRIGQAEEWPGCRP